MGMGKLQYSAGMLARHAFLSGRGVKEDERISDQDQQAWMEYCETEVFDILMKRIERDGITL